MGRAGFAPAGNRRLSRRTEFWENARVILHECAAGHNVELEQLIGERIGGFDFILHERLRFDSGIEADGQESHRQQRQYFLVGWHDRPRLVCILAISLVNSLLLKARFLARCYRRVVEPPVFLALRAIVRPSRLAG